MHPSENTRDVLLSAARRLFSEKGFDATTVREISDAAGVNISLISYHFNGKEGILQACLDQFGRARLASAQRLLQPPRSEEEFRVRLEMFMDEFFHAYLEHPEVTRIIQLRCELNPSLTDDIFKETFLKVFETLAGFVKGAQKNGIVPKDLDPLTTGSIMFASIVHFIRIDHMNQRHMGQTLKDAKYREKLSRHLIEILLHGVCAGKKGN